MSELLSDDIKTQVSILLNEAKGNPKVESTKVRKLLNECHTLLSSHKPHKAEKSLRLLRNELCSYTINTEIAWRHTYPRMSAEIVFNWSKGLPTYYKHVQFTDHRNILNVENAHYCQICNTRIQKVTELRNNESVYGKLWLIYIHNSPDFVVCTKHRVKTNKTLKKIIMGKLGILPLPSRMRQQISRNLIRYAHHGL